MPYVSPNRTPLVPADAMQEAARHAHPLELAFRIVM